MHKLDHYPTNSCKNWLHPKMLRHIIRILLFLLCIAVIKKVTSDDIDDQQELIRCAVEVANRNFNFRLITIILSKDVGSSLVNDFLVGYNGTVMIETKGSSPTKQVVMIVDNYQSFVKLLTGLTPELKGKNLFNGRAKYIIVLTTNRKKLDHITSILWNYYATKVVIIAKDRKNRVALYTFYPYKNHLNCQNTIPNIIGYWEDIKLDHIFPDKMLNMHECPLYISTNKIYHQATEQKSPLQVIKKTIVRLLRDVMNFTPIVSTRDYVSIDSDRAKNWSDSLNDVISGTANISTCTIPLGVDRLGLLDYSIPYFRVRLVWLAPPVRPGPVWWRLISPLNGYLWLILFLVTFFVVSLPFILKFRPLKKFCEANFKQFDRIQGAAFRVWGVMLGQTIRVTPQRFRDFYIISLWLWFSFVIRSAYQSVLIGALKTETLEGKFVNLKETIDHGYTFGGRAGIYAHFEFDPMIRDGFEIIPETKFDDVFRDIMDGRKKFVLAASLEYAFAYCLSQGKKENECGHVLPESILTVPLVVWMKIHSPFVKSLKVWLPRFLESGLLDKDANIKTSYVSSVSSDPSPLTRHQTLSCFLCLFLGFAISLVVFVMEILRKYTSKYTVVRKSHIEELQGELDYVMYYRE